MMKDNFERYITLLYKNIPTSVYECLISVFCIGTVIIISMKGIKKGWRYVTGLLLVEYVSLIFCTTLIFRKLAKTFKYNYTPFWSYSAIQDGNRELITQNIMNMLVFVPMGLLLGCAFCNMRWWKVLLIGSGISAFIEVMQFYYKRGFSEIDDVMHNTLGCMIGYGIYKLGALVVRQKNNI